MIERVLQIHPARVVEEVLLEGPALEGSNSCCSDGSDGCRSIGRLGKEITGL